MMTLNSQTKTLLVVAGVLILAYFLYNRHQFSNDDKDNITMEDNISSENSLPENIEGMDDVADNQSNNIYSNEGSNYSVNSSMSEETNNSINSAESAESAESADTEIYGDYEAKKRYYKNVPIPREDMIKYFPQRDYAPPESDWLKQKFNSRNKAKRGYKRSSYSGARRGDLGPSDWQAYFDHNNNVVGNSQTGENDNFLPIDESNGGFATFKSKGRATCGSNQNCEPEDLYDVDKYLPQEVNDDWFEVQPEPVSVKNRHLINITKPIGVNTIGTSLRNASHDIRGTPATPKFVVSPWLQSSIEVDTNLKPLF